MTFVIWIIQRECNKNGSVPASFSFIFVFFYKQLTVNKINKSCRWLDSNTGPLVLEATALPTAPNHSEIVTLGNQPIPVLRELILKVCNEGTRGDISKLRLL